MTEFSHEEFNEDSIEQFIIDSFSLHEKLISEAQENIPSKQFTRIKYADLVTNPLHEIEGIYTNLELGFISTKLKENIEQYLRKVENYQCNILEITTRQRVLIETQWTDILSRYR